MFKAHDILKLFSGLIILPFFLFSCEKYYFDAEPKSTPVAIFDAYWSDMNNFYPFFANMNVNWESSYLKYRPRINNVTTDEELLKVIADMIYPLNDGHLVIFTQYGNFGSGKKLTSYFNAQLVNPEAYLANYSRTNNNINYFFLKRYNMGYISINSFEGTTRGSYLYDKDYLIIDEIIDLFKDLDGIIIDVRWNPGGYSLNAETIASRFTDQKRIYAIQKTKNGPQENDYSGWSELYINPSGKQQFTKPVIVLTSRETASAAEYFTLAMKSLPQTEIVGDTTAGAVSGLLWREMANGWTYTLPTALIATPDSIIYNGRGIPPGNIVVQTKMDVMRLRDLSIEMAIKVIESKSKGTNQPQKAIY